MLNVVGALTRSWPSVNIEGTAEVVHMKLRHLASQTTGASSRFSTRSAVHTSTCTAIQQQKALVSSQPLPFITATRPARSSDQTGTTYTSQPGFARCDGSMVLSSSLQHHSCNLRMAETQCFAAGRHYQTSCSSHTHSSSQPLQDNPVAEHTQSEDAVGAVCWGCKQQLPRGDLVCNSCHKVQPVNIQLSYFEVMGL